MGAKIQHDVEKMEILVKECNSIEERFWSYVDKSGKCWIWTGSKHGPRGIKYGSFYKNGQRFKAHRLSYEMAYGKIPDGMLVCHKCDNGLCVNPEHLFLGTHRDNTHDMWNKGRGKAGQNHTKGSEHPHAKLTEEQVKSIRLEREAGATYKKICTRYDIDTKTLYLILKRQTWKHVL